jgi:hypothetical protein
MAKTTTKPWHQVVQLRDDITNQELSQKQFAADLYDVVMNRNPGVYHDAEGVLRAHLPHGQAARPGAGRHAPPVGQVRKGGPPTAHDLRRRQDALVDHAGASGA